MPRKVNGISRASPATDALEVIEAAIEMMKARGSVSSPSVIDPTANVLALTAAEAKRQDDLRAAESRRVDEQMTLRAYYDEKLAQGESKRIDAIRAVDVAAVATAQERATQQAAVLASQVAQSAETLRALVATTAATVTERLQLLEAAQYKAQGRTGLSTPLLTAIALGLGGLVVFVIQRLMVMGVVP